MQLELAKANNEMAAKLMKTLPKGSVFSPLSIGYALSLVHQGAIGNTETELTKFLGRKYTMDDLSALLKQFNNDLMKLTNALVINKNYVLHDSYLDSMRQLALINTEDFSQAVKVAKQINSYIEQKTNGMIKDIVKEEQVTPATVMFLINTVYFKANWDRPFEVALTRKELFNATTEVDMMTRTGKMSYYLDPTTKAQMIEMNYQGGQYCMGFILPAEGEDLRSCVSCLDKTQNCSTTKVKVHIPKFTHRKQTELVPLLQKLGVSDLFSSGSARLDKMTPQLGTCVSDIIHEAVVIVDEKGTEAAAVTVIRCMSESFRVEPDPVVFYANRPFLYYICHIPSNMMLFVGDYDGK